MVDCSCHAHNGFLTRAGYARVDELLHEGVDKAGSLWYLDKVGSVSGLKRDETQHELDLEKVDKGVLRCGT